MKLIEKIKDKAKGTYSTFKAKQKEDRTALKISKQKAKTSYYKAREGILIKNAKQKAKAKYSDSGTNSKPKNWTDKISKFSHSFSEKPTKRKRINSKKPDYSFLELTPQKKKEKKKKIKWF